MTESRTKQLHLTQDRSKYRERDHADANTDRRREFDWRYSGQQLLGITAANPYARQATQRRRNDNARDGEGGERTTIATQRARIQVQPRNESEYQHRDSRDSGEVRQRCGIDQDVIHLRQTAAEYRWSECDSHEDL